MHARVIVLAFIVLVSFRIEAGTGSTSCIDAPFEERSDWFAACFSRKSPYKSKHLTARWKKQRTNDCFREYAERFC